MGTPNGKKFGVAAELKTFKPFLLLSVIGPRLE